MSREGGADEGIRRLARECGLQTSYDDFQGNRREASEAALLATLHALGEPVSGSSSAANRLRERRAAMEQRSIEPVLVAWGGRLRGRLRSGRGSPARAEFQLSLEDGRLLEWRSQAAEPIAVPDRLPVGRHLLRVRTGRRTAEAVVLSAPARLKPAPDAPDLGVFLPLYALRSERAWGTADLSDLRSLTAWAADAGARMTGTLPLLATYLDEPFDPSPYSPVSRLFWNELYLDPEQSPDLASCAPARRLLGSASFRAHAAALCRADLVDYRAAMRLKRRVLDRLAESAFASAPRRRELERFAKETGAGDYARFRAAAAHHQAGWPGWPDRPRSGRLSPRDYEESERRYHVYAQWLLARQLAALREDADARGAELYLDLPIGVHGGGYDVWRYRESFATGASVGAPPDALFSGGQNWGFPPMHPDHSRRDGHAYFAACVRNHLRYARVLRVDHVMGLYRLFWIPRGIEAGEGVYVRYPADELFAVLAIESHLAGARVIGENLGTVPPEVTETMRRRGVLGMHVGQFSFQPDTDRPVPDAPAGNLACLNTHDLPTFAAFCTKEDVRLREKLGIVSPGDARRESRERAAIVKALTSWSRSREGGRSRLERLLRAVLEQLAASEADVLLVTLEDLWLETRPQNVPGISKGYPNWRKKAAVTLERLHSDPGFAELLRTLAERRSERVAPRRRSRKVSSGRGKIRASRGGR